MDLVGSPHVVNANTHVLCAISRPKANTVQWLTAAGKQARKNYLLKRKSYLIIAQIYFCMLDGRPFCEKEKKNLIEPVKTCSSNEARWVKTCERFHKLFWCRLFRGTETLLIKSKIWNIFRCFFNLAMFDYSIANSNSIQKLLHTSFETHDVNHGYL